MPDRAYRFVIPGWLFVMSLGFHYWSLDGSLPFEPDRYRILLGLVGALAAGPVLGFMVSTVVVLAVESFGGHLIHFLLPSGRKEFKNWLEALKSHFPDDFLSEQLKEAGLEIDEDTKDPIPYLLRRESAPVLHRLFNLAIRVKGDREALDFAVRRWTTFWANANSIGAIVLGLMFAYFSRLYMDWDDFRASTVDSGRVVLELPLVAYVVLAGWHSMRARKEAIDFERAWLLGIPPRKNDANSDHPNQGHPLSQPNRSPQGRKRGPVADDLESRSG